MQIAQLLSLVIFVSVSLVREKLRGFEGNFKTQNPNLNPVQFPHHCLEGLPFGILGTNPQVLAKDHPYHI